MSKVEGFLSAEEEQDIIDAIKTPRKTLQEKFEYILRKPQKLMLINVLWKCSII